MLSLSDSCGRTASCMDEVTARAEGLVLVRSFGGPRARVTAPSSTACLWSAGAGGEGRASCEDGEFCLELRCLERGLPGAADAGGMSSTLGRGQHALATRAGTGAALRSRKAGQRIVDSIQDQANLRRVSYSGCRPSRVDAADFGSAGGVDCRRRQAHVVVGERSMAAVRLFGQRGLVRGSGLDDRMPSSGHSRLLQTCLRDIRHSAFDIRHSTFNEESLTTRIDCTHRSSITFPQAFPMLGACSLIVVTA